MFDFSHRIQKVAQVSSIRIPALPTILTIQETIQLIYIRITAFASCLHLPIRIRHRIQGTDLKEIAEHSIIVKLFNL